MQQQVQCAQVGQFVAVHAALNHLAEESFDALGRNFAQQDRVVSRLPGNYSDVADIALVAGAGVGDAGERDFHSTTSTRVRISSRGISAGQYATIWRTSGRPSPYPVPPGGPVSTSGIIS